MMSVKEQMQKNIETRFVDNPCRGIIVGRLQSKDLVQLAWIMGRSDNSKNRVYVKQRGMLMTTAADPKKVEDPSLIIYTVMRQMTEVEGAQPVHHIVSNGDQTDSIIEYFRDTGMLFFSAQIFYDALSRRFCEPDPSTFTPRITGYQSLYSPDKVFMSVLAPEPAAKELWIAAEATSGLKIDDFRSPGKKESEARKEYNDEIASRSGLDYTRFPTIRKFYELPLQNGTGYCLTTYKEGNSKGLDAFVGDPFLVPIVGNSVEDVMNYFWEKLEPEWKVAMGGKQMNDTRMYIAEPINRFKRVTEGSAAR